MKCLIKLGHLTLTIKFNWKLIPVLNFFIFNNYLHFYINPLRIISLMLKSVHSDAVVNFIAKTPDNLIYIVDAD